MNRDTLVGKLKQKTLTVTFTKVSTGEKRVMNCTLKEDMLPPTKGSNHAKSTEVIPVWDTDNEGWRSFRLDSIISIK